MTSPIVIGNYIVTADSETFRIFPKNRFGQTVPVTRINNFLYLRSTKSDDLVIFKRYLHQKNWYWRDSRDVKPSDERSVQREVARMLFGGDMAKAGALLTQVVAGVSELAVA